MTSSWGKKWGRADLVKLQRLAGVMPVSSICATLKRSEHSVRAKARLLGLDLSVNPYWFTTNEIAHAMGVKHHTVNAWVRRGWLPSKTTGKVFFTIQQIKYFHQWLKCPGAWWKQPYAKDLMGTGKPYQPLL